MLASSDPNLLSAMSFKFNWNFFNVEELKEHSKVAITKSIAESKRPDIMADPLEVTDIDFGTRPPKLAFDSIKQVEVGRAHIVFRIKYDGDATITLKTRLHANPLREMFISNQWPAFVQPTLVGARNPLEIPFELKLKSIHLDGYMDVVYTKNGLTVLFSDDLVTHVETESSLDGVPGVNKMITSMLSKVLAEAFEEDVPEMVWKVTNPTKLSPDPTLGPRRWRQHLIQKTMFRQLGLGSAHIDDITPFNTLSLSAHIPGAILNTRQRPGVPIPSHGTKEDGIDMADLLADDTASEYSFTSTTSTGEHKRPRRRKISLRKVSQKLASETPTESPASNSVTSSPAKSNSVLQSLSPSTPPMSPEHALVEEYDDASEYSPQVVRLGPRRHSSPGLRHRHRKLRTASLQPQAKPQIRRHTNLEPAFE